MKQTKEQKEVSKILKDINGKCELPDKEKNILDWSLSELKAYIFNETKGMSVKKKVEFGKELNERIKKERNKHTLIANIH
jgi:hypothetical protein